MDITEYREILKKYDLNDQKLCDAIFISTGAIIKPKHIRTAFDRGNLSEPMTAVIRLMGERLANAGKA